MERARACQGFSGLFREGSGGYAFAMNALEAGAGERPRFERLSQSAGARRGRLNDLPRRGVDSRVHARRDPGVGQVAHSEAGRRARRRDPALEYVSSDAAPWSGPGGGARRAPPIHELVEAGAHRQRRLPGRESFGAAARRRRGSHLSVPPRWQPALADSGARRRDPGEARLRRRHGPRPVPSLSLGSSGRPRRGAAEPRLGGALEEGPLAARPSPVRYRSGRGLLAT